MSSVINKMSELYLNTIRTALAHGAILEDATALAIETLYASDYAYSFVNYWEGEGDEADELRNALWSIDFSFEHIGNSKVSFLFH